MPELPLYLDCRMPFVLVPWADLKAGDWVYWRFVCTTMHDEAYNRTAYGPALVIDPAGRVLAHKNGHRFAAPHVEPLMLAGAGPAAQSPREKGD